MTDKVLEGKSGGTRLAELDWARLIGFAAGVLSLLAGGVALAGWISGTEAWVRVGVDMGPVRPDAALVFCLAGGALVLQCKERRVCWRLLSGGLGLSVVALGLMGLYGEFTTHSADIFQSLFLAVGERLQELPRALSPYSMLTLTCLGLAVVGNACRLLSPLVYPLAALVLVLALLSLVDQTIYSTGEGLVGALSPMTRVSASIFLVLSMGTLLIGLSHRGENHEGYRRIEWRVLVGFIAIFLLLGVGGTLTYEAGDRFSAKVQRTDELHRFRAVLSSLESEITDFEVLQLSTQGAEPLARVTAQRYQQQIQSAIKRLYLLLGQDERIQALTRQLEATNRRWSPETPLSKYPLTELRRQASYLDEVTRLHIWQEQRSSATIKQHALLYLLVTLAGIASFATLLFQGIRREMIMRLQTQDQLEQLNTTLAQQVENRTAALKQQQALKRLVLDNLAEGVVACDLKGELTLMNRTLRDWLGLEQIDSTDDIWQGLYESDGKTPLKREQLPLQRALAGEELRGLEISIVSASQPKRRVLVSGGPLRDADGGLQGAVVTLNDVTEHYRNARRFATLFEHAPDASIICAPDGQILQCNQRAEQLFGWDRQRLLGQQVEVLLPEQMRSQHHAFRAAFNGAPSALRMETRGQTRLMGLHHSGRSFPIEVSLSPIHSDNEQLTLVFLRDVSEREQFLQSLQQTSAELAEANQRVERERAQLAERVEERTRALERARQRAEQASQAKSIFLATMSHEIRTPMNGVVGMLDVLSHSRLEAEQRDALDTARESALALLRIIDDILDFSKIEAGQLAIERIPVALRSLCQGVCTALRAVARERQVDLHLQIEDDLPGWIWSDPVRLRQILFNLIGNAIKFTLSDHARQGRVDVRVGWDGTAQLLQIDVRDNGIGMSEETLRNLFRDFSQGEVSTTRRFGGSGLGLAICKRLLGMMGGEISVDSTLGEGSCFIVRLPLESAPAGPAVPVSSGGAEGREVVDIDAEAEGVSAAREEGRLILIAEDDSINQKVILRQLELLGYTGELAHNGREALELWRNGYYGLVLSDLHMPEMDGYELARAIRAEESEGARTPIIALTANAVRGEEQPALEAGMDAFMTKPVQLSVLKNTLEHWLPSAVGAEPVDTGVADDAEFIDLQVLRELVGDDGEVVEELLRAYQGSAESQCQALQIALQQSDIGQAARLSHTLKASSRSVGALRLGDLCAEIENACKARDHAALTRLQAEFDQLYPTVFRHLIHLLADLN